MAKVGQTILRGCSRRYLSRCWHGFCTRLVWPREEMRDLDDRVVVIDGDGEAAAAEAVVVLALVVILLRHILDPSRVARQSKVGDLGSGVVSLEELRRDISRAIETTTKIATVAGVLEEAPGGEDQVGGAQVPQKQDHRLPGQAAPVEVAIPALVSVLPDVDEMYQ